MADKIAPVSELFAPVASALADLLAGYSQQQIVATAQLLEQTARLLLARIEELERGNG